MSGRALECPGGAIGTVLDVDARLEERVAKLVGEIVLCSRPRADSRAQDPFDERSGVDETLPAGGGELDELRERLEAGFASLRGDFTQLDWSTQRGRWFADRLPRGRGSERAKIIEARRCGVGENTNLAIETPVPV